MSKVYYNKPQMIAQMINAPEEYHIWGRGTGKSSGRIAPKMVSNIFSMPRGLGVMIADTFQSALTKTLPGIIDGLRRMGYEQDRDFFFGKFAPHRWKWDRPYNCPVKPNYFMHWRNGSGMMLVSQDRVNSANGMNVDWIVGDEAKFLNQRQYEEELLPANRGHRQRFSHAIGHHSILLCTDMPTQDKGQWVRGKKEDFYHPDNFKRYQAILALELKIQDLEKRMGTFTPSSQKKYRSHINSLKKDLFLLRKGDASKRIPALVHYSEADSFTNIHILGEEYMIQMAKTLSPAIYRTSILNLPLDEVPHGFYPLLKDSTHSYTDYDNHFLDQFEFNFKEQIREDSRQDKDVLRDRPLGIGLDFGGSINCMAIGQLYGDTYRLLKSMYQLHPKKLDDLIIEFKRYYKHHQNKTVRFYYDHTATGTNAMLDKNYAEEVISILRRDDQYGSWRVDEHYIGATPSHQFRFDMWNRLLEGKDESLPSFRYHEKNASSWALSCQLTALKSTRKGFEKDKSKEKRLDYPQEQAPHLSDAGDTLIFGELQHKLTGKGSSPFISVTI